VAVGNADCENSVPHVFLASLPEQVTSGIRKQSNPVSSGTLPLNLLEFDNSYALNMMYNDGICLYVCAGCQL